MHNKVTNLWNLIQQAEDRGRKRMYNSRVPPVPWQTWQHCCSQNLHPPDQKCFEKSTSYARAHRVNYTESSFKLKVINFTPYYMQGVQKNQKIGNERLAGALSGTREITDLISSVIYEISTNSFGRSIKQCSQKKKKKKMALSKLKMLHWKFWKYKIWLQSKTEADGKPENLLSLSAETTAEKTLNRTQLKADG